jgi:ATP-dependent Lon protease
VRWIDEVLDLALERPLQPAAGKSGGRSGKKTGGRRQRAPEERAGVKH